MNIINSKITLTCLTLIIGASTTLGLSNTQVIASVKDQTQEQNENIFATLTGFEPNATVHYRISSGNNIPHIIKTGRTDTLGNLIIPMPEEFTASSPILKYNFLVDEEKNSLNVVLVHHTQDGTLSVEGSGTDEFTRIVVESPEKTVETKSDWAGLFEEKKIKNVWSQDKKTPYKIAFFNTAPGQDVRSLTRTPSIKVQFSPGGGTLEGEEMNTYNPEYCDSESGVQPAYCNTGSVNSNSDKIAPNFVEGLQLMAHQFTLNAYQQVFAIAQFFDAKERLETQNDLRVMATRAHKDYHPSEQLCSFGSYIKNVAETEDKIQSEAMALNDVLMEYYLNRTNGSSGGATKNNLEARFRQYRTVYCNPMDNGGSLSFLCEHDQDGNISDSDSSYRDGYDDGIGASNIQRMNKDINYFKTFAQHLTLDVDFTDGQTTEDEEDLIALAKNLYWPTTYKSLAEDDVNENKPAYMDARRLISLYNIAHNSYAQQVAMKTQTITTDAEGEEDDKIPGWAHMKTLMRDFGLSDNDIEKIIGDRPSYYAQMDILTKKLYQNPDFYTNLYDKPANVDRIAASLEAIATMQMRDHYKTMLRQEMLSSALLQTAITPRFETVSSKLENAAK